MILTRHATADDRPFIVSGWSSSYRPSLNETRPGALYARQKHEEVNYYLDRCDTLVAHGEAGVLFGFIAYDPTTYVAGSGERRRTLHGSVLYLYVAEPFRRRGIARRLLAMSGIERLSRFGYLCQTRWSWLLRSKLPLAEHEPYRARYEEISHGRRTDAEHTEAPATTGGPEGPGADPGQ